MTNRADTTLSYRNNIDNEQDINMNEHRVISVNRNNMPFGNTRIMNSITI